MAQFVAGTKTPMHVRGKSFLLIEAALECYCVERSLIRRRSWLLFPNGLALGIYQLRSPRILLRAIRQSLRVGKPKKISLPGEAESFLVKNNIRMTLAEFGSRRSVKIALPSEWRTGSLSREIKARTLMAQRNAAPVPMLLDYDRKSLAWVEDELIADTGFSASEKITRFLDNVAMESYKPCVRSGSVGAFLRTKNYPLEEVAHLCGFQKENLDTLTWPISMTHGDLSAGNMMFANDGRLILVDWEDFGKRPVADDLRSLYQAAPHKVLDLLGRLNNYGDLSPRKQMRIAFAARLAKLERESDKMLRYFQDQLGMSAQAAHKRLLEIKADHVKLVSERPPARSAE